MKMDSEEEIKIKKFGLRIKKTGKLVRFSTRSNEGKDFCGDTTTELNDYGDQDWLVDKALVAEYVRNFSTEWYNAGYETPLHHYEPEELEVVQVTIITRVCPLHVKIPTAEEYFKLKYGPGAKYENPEHLEMVLRDIRSPYRDIKYSLYDITELLAEEGIHKRIRELEKEE